MSDAFPPTPSEKRIDTNPFSLCPRFLVVGDIVHLGGQTPVSHKWLILKNRKGTLDIFRMDLNEKGKVKYTDMSRINCVYVMREGVECKSFPELQRAC